MLRNHFKVTAVLILSVLFFPGTANLLSGSAPDPSGDSQELQVSVKTNKQVYGKSEPVHITVVLSNSGPNQTTLHFSTTCQSTFRIEDSSRTWYDHRRHVACGLAFTEVTVPPGGTVTYSFTWNQIDDAGNQVPVPQDLLVRGIILHIDDIPPLEDTASIRLRNGGSAPVAAFTWEPCVFCLAPGNVVFFNANVSVGSIIQYTWNFGDGSAPVNTTDPFATHMFFTSKFTVTVSLTVHDPSGMTDSVSHPISFNIVPRFTYEPGKPAPGTLVTFNASTTATYGPEIVEFGWEFGDGATGTGNLTSHSYTSPGIYRVVLTLLTEQGTFSMSKAIVVAIEGSSLPEDVDRDGDVDLDDVIAVYIHLFTNNMNYDVDLDRDVDLDDLIQVYTAQFGGS